MYIHLMEMSPHPERALRAADALRDLVPDAGHLVHMPTHIDVLCGHYRGGRLERPGDRGRPQVPEARGRRQLLFALPLPRLSLRIYGAMFLGQYATALAAADEMIATLPERLLRIELPPMADWLEGFVPMKLHVLIRFGRWDEILDAPLPRDQKLFCITTAMMHYAKAVAHAATGDRGGGGEGSQPLQGRGRARAGLRAICSTTPASTSWRWPPR